MTESYRLIHDILFAKMVVAIRNNDQSLVEELRNLDNQWQDVLQPTTVRVGRKRFFTHELAMPTKSADDYIRSHSAEYRAIYLLPRRQL